MKKLATLVMFLCLGAFTIGPVAGCGGKDEKKDEKKEEKKDDEKKDDAGGDDAGSADS